MKCPYCIKVCNKCGRLLVANEMNFNKNKGGKYGLRNDCKNCKSRYYQNNKEIKNKDNPFKNVDPNKVWNHCPFCIKVCSECNSILVANKSNYSSQSCGKYGLISKCKRCQKKYNQYWAKENPEKACERVKRWQKNNPDKIFNRDVKRRQLEESLGEGITKDQWYEMMNFFEWKCAYSGISLKKGNRSVDHIIPLNKKGENEIWNCVPMLFNYNPSKGDDDMLNWYKQQDFFSEERLNKIYEWQKYAKNKYKNKKGEENE